MTVRSAILFGSIAAVATLVGGCTSAGEKAAPAASDPAAAQDVPSWCGPKPIEFGLLDGNGGNSWRLVATATGMEETAKCPSVTGFRYADGQGNTLKAISDIKGMVAAGVDAMVVFPDAGKAVLPALTAAYQEGVVTVPYRVDPGGEAGVNYDEWIGDDFANDAHNWAAWIKKNVPKGGNILFLGGPAGSSQSTTEYEALSGDLGSDYNFIGQTPFQPTNWEPTLTQQLLTADIAKYPKIDVIVSDFGPTLVSALPLFTKSGRPIPALATSDGNSLSCFWAESQKTNPFDMITVTTGNDNVRLAIQHAVALATGGQPPTEKAFKGPVFEDSTDPAKPVQCRSDLPPDTYLSASMPGDRQAQLDG